MTRPAPVPEHPEEVALATCSVLARARPWFVSLVAVLLFAACSSGPEERPFPQVAHIARSQYDAVPALVARTDWVICEGSTSEHCRLDGAAALAMGGDGHVLVAARHGKLVELDSAGQFVRAFGGAEFANGDYGSVASVTLDSALNVWLFDVRGWSWIGFTRSGAFLERRSVAPNILLRSFAARAGALFLQLVPPGPHVGAPVGSTFLRLSARDSVRPFAVVPALALQTDSSDLMPMLPPFSARPVWDVGPGGRLLYSNGAQYTIMCFSANGRPELAILGDSIESREVTLEDLESERAAREARTSGERNSVLRAGLAAVDAAAPGRHPAITELRALRDSTLMVRRVPSSGGDSVRWDLWNHEGRLVGHVQLGKRDHVVDGDRTRLLVASWSLDLAGRVAWLRIGGP